MALLGIHEADPVGAAQRGLSFILAGQSADGAWRDFTLPVGQSDAWVSAFVGAQVACCSDDAWQAAQRAADWLRANRRSDGWGYNGSVEPDADSTAWAALLFASLGREPAPGVLGILIRHQHEDGGISTYRSADGWGLAHACVTAATARALAVLGAREDARRARRWLRAARPTGMGWSGYWWASAFYPTMVALDALADEGLEGEEHALLSASNLGSIRSIVDLACALKMLSVSAPGHPLVGELVASLCTYQCSDGSWPASQCLRVTHHCERAVQDGDRRGRIYSDHRRLFGTALAVGALVEAGRGA